MRLGIAVISEEIRPSEKYVLSPFNKDNKKEADNSAEHAVFMAAIISVFLSLIGLMFGKTILAFFGAEGEILNLGWEYLRVMCFGMPFMIFQVFSVLFWQVRVI